MSRDTDIVQSGHSVPGEAVPLTTPIFETTTYVFDSAADVVAYNQGTSAKYLYTRYGNPTVVAVEQSLARLDGAEKALLFGSGMAATASTLIGHLKAGDEVLCAAAIYGGTLHLLQGLLSRFGVTTRFVSAAELAALDSVVAYHEVVPLTEAEIRALWPLVVLRGAVLVVAGEHQAALDPDNAAAVAALPELRRQLDAWLSATGDQLKLPVKPRLLADPDAWGPAAAISQ